MAGVDLEYYIFDWDDNILFMPTPIHMERDGAPVDVSTAGFAHLRHDASCRPLAGDWQRAFSSFRDPPSGDGDFVGDTKQAIAQARFAPSFPAFKKVLTSAALFAIVTARGHAAATLRKGLDVVINHALSAAERRQMVQSIQTFNRLAEWIVPDDECVRQYLDLNTYVGVSAPGLLRMFTANRPPGLAERSVPARDPEQAKTIVVRQFVDNALRLTGNLAHAEIRQISFGFSDDDRGGYASMCASMEQDLVLAFPGIRFFMYDSSGNRIRAQQTS